MVDQEHHGHGGHEGGHVVPAQLLALAQRTQDEGPGAGGRRPLGHVEGALDPAVAVEDALDDVGDEDGGDHDPARVGEQQVARRYDQQPLADVQPGQRL